MTGSYELGPLFQIRMPGVPFDALESVSTPRSLAIAREIAARRGALDGRATAALEALRADGDGLGGRQRERLRRAIGMRLAIARVPPGAPDAVRSYVSDHTALDALCARYGDALGRELDEAAASLQALARRYLPAYSLFASASVENLAFDLDGGGARGAWDRQRHRHLLMYLQRLATKNETFSEFGPSGWGRVVDGLAGAAISPSSELRRHAYLERWVAAVVVAAMNRDPAVRPEIAPRLHPNGRLEESRFVRVDTGRAVALSAEDVDVLQRCDGRTPGHAIAAQARLSALADGGVLAWEIDCPAHVVDRIADLQSDVARWRDAEARRRWEPLLAALASVPDAFAREVTPSGRREVVERTRRLLADIGAPADGKPQRLLYRATNPIGEECVRECGFQLGNDAAREVATRAAPWFDLWRDTVNFVAHRANEKLRAVHAAVGRGRPVVPLPALLGAANAAGLSLAGEGVPALAYLAFQEVKAAFREEAARRPDAPAWELSAEDCAFVRRRFQFPRFTEFTHPSADLQLAARSLDDVAAGRHRWVVAELHLAAVVIQHGIYWACPDPDGFGKTVRAMAGGPLFDWGFAAADLVTHTMIRSEPLSGLWTDVGAGRSRPEWPSARPADAEVYVAADGDVRVRVQGRDCGSFARSWVLALGLHPFILARPPHTPRLTVGGVVVQRECWVVGRADLPGAYRHGAPDLAIDVDRLRRSKGIPRYVYIRPTEAAVRRLAAGGRDKDVKPVFVDLESYPFIDVLARWMAKHGEIEIVEMLPGPDDLPWREQDGRRTFELRTLLAPSRQAPGRAGPRDTIGGS